MREHRAVQHPARLTTQPHRAAMHFRLQHARGTLKQHLLALHTGQRALQRRRLCRGGRRGAIDHLRIGGTGHFRHGKHPPLLILLMRGGSCRI